MKSIFIVDDEILVRVGVRALHDWESSGYSVVGDASSVRDALPMIQSLKPDLVLTDLVMHPDDGFTLIRRLRETGFTAGIVVLSCRNDFDAVRNAMHEGADDYVFKLTMQADEMLQVFQKVLERRAAPASGNLSLPAKDEGGSLGAAHAWLQGQASAEADAEAELRPQIPWVWGPDRYRLFVLQTSPFPLSQQEPALSALPRLLSDLARRDLPAFRVWVIGPGRLAGVMLEAQASGFAALFEALWEFTYRYCGLNLSGGGSRALRGWSSLPAAWTQAHEAVEHCFRSGESAVLRERVPDLKPLDLLEVYQAVDAFRREVPPLDSSRLQELAQRFLERLATSVGSTPATMVQLVWDFLHPLRERLALRALGADSAQDWVLATGFEVLKSCRSLPELGPLVAASIEATVMRLRNCEATRYRPEIAKTIQWIEERLSSSASVEEAARRVNMSESHFAHVFKEETGLSFLKFLIRRKMDRATDRLLETDLLVYEVAQELGYENANHFSTLFKQTTGVSPQELRSGRNREMIRSQADGRQGTQG